MPFALKQHEQIKNVFRNNRLEKPWFTGSQHYTCKRVGREFYSTPLLALTDSRACCKIAVKVAAEGCMLALFNCAAVAARS